MIVIDKKEKFVVVTSSVATNYITTWDKMDIKEFNATQKAYCPFTTDFSQYYEISEEEYNNYEMMQQKAFEEENNKEIDTDK